MTHAADRLALYRALYAERYGQGPERLNEYKEHLT